MSKTRDKLSLAGVYEFRSGLSKPRSAFGTGAPFLSFKDVFYNSAVPEPLKELVESSAKEQHNCSVRRGDVFLTRTSETMDELGMSCVALKDIPGATFNGFCKRLRPKVADQIVPEYARYFFRSKRFRDQVNAMATMSTRASLNNEMLERLEIDTPAIVEQSAIGAILGTLDEKIELNHKMNQTLEEIAKAIFKSWFVDFDPVRAKAEGRPTGLPPEISDLFPDELVDSEIGEIPKGWDVGTLSDVADITMGQSPPGGTYNDDGVGLPFYQGSTDFGFRFPSLRKYCSEPKRLADADDVLISVRAPVGDLNRAKDDCCIGRGLASVRAKNSLQTWVFYRCKFLSKQLETFNSEGTVFGSINGKDLKGLPTILAPEVLCKAFDEIAKPMDDAVRNRTVEIEVLTELRDTLLPKLISGDLRIPDAEKFLEEVGL